MGLELVGDTPWRCASAPPAAAICARRAPASLGWMQARLRLRRLLGALLVALWVSPSFAAELVVQWTPLAVSVEGYQVERQIGDSGESFEPIARVGGGETRFTDRGLRAGVRYCYRVRGVRGERVSRASTPLCSVALERAAPQPAAAEGAPPADVASAPSAVASTPSGGEFREVKALHRPPPAYPREAQLQGLSGWVKLSFTVTAQGGTRDVRVVAAEPSGVFDQAAIDAAQRFVYEPRLENGVPVDRPNVETEITFTWIDRGGDLVTDLR